MKRRKLQIKDIKRKYRRVLRCYLRTKLNFNSQYVRRLTYDEMFKDLHKTGGSYDFWINFKFSIRKKR